MLKARMHYTLSLNLQCPRLNLRALYGLISAAKALEDLKIPPPSGQKRYIHCNLSSDLTHHCDRIGHVCLQERGDNLFYRSQSGYTADTVQ
jgi:hypothetical protein